jgi:hypothetical protein
VAGAEIYGWVDPSGDVTYSNLPPPKSARVFDVIPEAPPPSPQALANAAAAHESEMRALNEKVQQMEQEMQQARWQASAPPPPYYPSSAPTSYGPPPSYAPAYSYGNGCDAEQYDCGLWDGPIYSTGIVPFWGFRGHRDHDHDHDRDGFRHGHHFSHTVGGPHSARISTASAVHAGGHATAGHSSGGMGHGR